jgi:hypothetical protein
MATIWMFTWTEYERGWGQRPDGCSIHASESDAKEFLEEYWAKEPKTAPDEYSKQDSDTPTEIIIHASNKFYKHLMSNCRKDGFTNGIFLSQGELHELRAKMDNRPRVGK